MLGFSLKNGLLEIRDVTRFEDSIDVLNVGTRAGTVCTLSEIPEWNSVLAPRLKDKERHNEVIRML